MDRNRFDKKIMDAICEFIDRHPQVSLFVLSSFVLAFFAAVRGCANGG